jgi:hypothetical protein
MKVNVISQQSDEIVQDFDDRVGRVPARPPLLSRAYGSE